MKSVLLTRVSLTAFLATLILVFRSSVACASGFVWLVVEKDPEWTSDERSYCFRMADFSLAPTGMRVQVLHSELEDILSPPTTNTGTRFTDRGGVDDFWGYHTIPAICEHWFEAIWTGIDVINQGYPGGDGCVYAVCEGADWRYAWLRVFSHTTITGAAYYGDTQARSMEEFAEWYDYWDTTNFFVTTVNPAYIIPDFSLASAFSSHYEQTTLAISGHVGTVAGIHNNRLHDNVVTVHWWCVAVTNYLNHTTVTNSGVIAVFGGGTWTGQIELVRYQPFDYFGTTNTLFLRAIGASPRPEFPRSYDLVVENLVTVPEPSAVLVTLLLPFLRRCKPSHRYARRRIAHDAQRCVSQAAHATSP